MSSALTPFAVAGAMLLATVPFGVFVFGDARPCREIAGTAPHVTHQALTLLAILALAVAVPQARDVHRTGVGRSASTPRKSSGGSSTSSGCPTKTGGDGDR